MLDIFFPDERIDNVYIIDFEKYYRAGYRGIICDIDNTFVPHGKPANRKAEELFRKIKDIGFDTVLLSNNNEARVDLFNKNIGSKFVCMAHKPDCRGFMEAMHLMGTTPETTICLGDQIFTDMWGARKCGIHAILTTPLYPKEKVQILLKRPLEKIVLLAYELQKK